MSPQRLASLCRRYAFSCSSFKGDPPAPTVRFLWPEFRRLDLATEPVRVEGCRVCGQFRRRTERVLSEQRGGDRWRLTSLLAHTRNATVRFSHRNAYTSYW